MARSWPHLDTLHPAHRDCYDRSRITIEWLMTLRRHPGAPFADGSGDPYWGYHSALQQRRFQLAELTEPARLPTRPDPRKDRGQ